MGVGMSAEVEQKSIHDRSRSIPGVCAPAPPSTPPPSLAQNVQPTFVEDNAANLKKSTLPPARSPASRSKKAPRIPLKPKKSLERTFKPPKDTRTLADPWAENYDTLLALPPSSAVFTKEVKSTKHAQKSPVAEKSSG